LFLAFGLPVLAQSTTVQIELVQPQVGHPIMTGWTSCGSESNDSGLNAIFAAHNVSNYCSATFLSYPELELVDGGLIDCPSCDASALIADLEAYSAVIGRARLTPGYEIFANYLWIKLINDASQTGSDAANVIVTSDPALNAVFESFTVYSYEQHNANWKTVICDCYAPDLLDALLIQGFILPNSIDENSGATIYDNHTFQNIAYLDTPAFEAQQIKVVPNPFNDFFTITGDDGNSQFSIYDLSGKKIGIADSVTGVQTLATSLQPGIYIMQIANGNNTEIIKIAKR
ncbi:MAG: T9SS type A sorting domain-containing protein, partial [Flavobacterium sp.]|nr:T9SS type A sorting domain-containing protein [Flavobacterium sp.]